MAMNNMNITTTNDGSVIMERKVIGPSNFYLQVNALIGFGIGTVAFLMALMISTSLVVSLWWGIGFAIPAFLLTLGLSTSDLNRETVVYNIQTNSPTFSLAQLWGFKTIPLEDRFISRSLAHEHKDAILSTKDYDLVFGRYRNRDSKDIQVKRKIVIRPLSLKIVETRIPLPSAIWDDAFDAVSEAHSFR